MADDFFTKQLPHNVTWGLTVLYALDASKDLTNLAVQVILLVTCLCRMSILWSDLMIYGFSTKNTESPTSAMHVHDGLLPE